MDVLAFIRNAVQTGLNTLSGRVVRLLSQPKKSAFPLADRLLADAFRLGQLPSPLEQEKERASFVVARLEALGIPSMVDEAGSILACLHSFSGTEISPEPLLVFTRLVSERWNSLESLGKLELQYAQGAGLADALGPAALLSLAEAYAMGRINLERDLFLFFSALHFDDPLSDVFRIFTSTPKYRPGAAIGVRGFKLGFLTSHSLGSYRVELTFAEEEGKAADSNAVVSALIDSARHFQKMAETFGPDLNFYLSRIEAKSTFDRTPTEGILELELEAASGEILDKALEDIKAASEIRAFEGVKTTLRVVSSIPSGNPRVSEQLTQTLLETMKELKIKAVEEAKPDPASFLSTLGIPALTVGIASGKEGRTSDTVEIASLEKGRQLLELLVIRAGGKNG